MKARKALLAIAGAGAALVAVAPVASAASSPATPATRYAASATGYQNATIAMVMKREPGGTRVSAGEVVWHRDGDILRVPVSARARVSSVKPDQSFYGCPYGYACVYSGVGFTGFAYQCPSSYIAGYQYFCPLGAVGFGTGGSRDVESWVNYTAYRAWLQEYESHTSPGYEYCETPRYGNNSPSYSSNFTGQAAGNLATWMWMSNNTASC